MTKEFLSNKTLDPGEAEDYIDPKLVHSIVAKTVPKLQSHSGVYSSTSGPFHKSRPVNTHLEQDQVKNDRGPHSDLPRDIGSTSEKIRLPTSQRFVRSRSNVWSQSNSIQNPVLNIFLFVCLIVLIKILKYITERALLFSTWM